MGDTGVRLEEHLQPLLDAGYPVHLWGFSALKRYHGQRAGRRLCCVTAASLVDLSRLYDTISFPSLPRVSVRARFPSGCIDFYCTDSFDVLPVGEIAILGFRYDPERGVFPDPHGVYPAVRAGEFVVPEGATVDTLADTAVLLSHFPLYSEPSVVHDSGGRRLSADEQRELLLDILDGAAPWRGLDLLERIGFVGEYWPELGDLREVDHDKDFHPEGDGWQHSMEALKQRKTRDPLLSLALLLHDVGKPVAERNGERAFDNHAWLGVKIARRFLSRLGVDGETVADVEYLVRNHMLPAALHRMPGYRVEQEMGAGLYPLLLEVYRADLLATWADDGEYHEAFRQYRRFLKNRKNPYRDIRGAVRRY